MRQRVGRENASIGRENASIGRESASIGRDHALFACDHAIFACDHALFACDHALFACDHAIFACDHAISFWFDARSRPIDAFSRPIDAFSTPCRRGPTIEERVHAIEERVRAIEERVRAIEERGWLRDPSAEGPPDDGRSIAACAWWTDGPGRRAASRACPPPRPLEHPAPPARRSDPSGSPSGSPAGRVSPPVEWWGRGPTSPRSPPVLRRYLERLEARDHAPSAAPAEEPRAPSQPVAWSARFSARRARSRWSSMSCAGVMRPVPSCKSQPQPVRMRAA